MELGLKTLGLNPIQFDPGLVEKSRRIKRERKKQTKFIHGSIVSVLECDTYSVFRIRTPYKSWPNVPNESLPISFMFMF